MNEVQPASYVPCLADLVGGAVGIVASGAVDGLLENSRDVGAAQANGARDLVDSGKAVLDLAEQGAAAVGNAAEAVGDACPTQGSRSADDQSAVSPLRSGVRRSGHGHGPSVCGGPASGWHRPGSRCGSETGPTGWGGRSWLR
jgi:hypothetical protein